MIFYDNTDRDNFLARLGSVLTETGRPCFAWALIPNHLHLLIRTGSTPIATVMRRRLAGQAVTFNRRRRRHGQLFQNRYKSTLCQEDLNRKSQLEATGYGLDWMVGRVARQREVEPKVVLAPGKYASNVKARSLLCYWKTRELGMTTVGLARRLYLAQPTVSQAVKRGQMIAEEPGLSLLGGNSQ